MSLSQPALLAKNLKPPRMPQGDLFSLKAITLLNKGLTLTCRTILGQTLFRKGSTLHRTILLVLDPQQQQLLVKMYNHFKQPVQVRMVSLTSTAVTKITTRQCRHCHHQQHISKTKKLGIWFSRDSYLSTSSPKIASPFDFSKASQLQDHKDWFRTAQQPMMTYNVSGSRSSSTAAGENVQSFQAAS
jgi:hypothetical protein